MQIDACKLGICNLYDSGSSVIGLIVGVAIGATLILIIQRIGRHRKGK